VEPDDAGFAAGAGLDGVDDESEDGLAALDESEDEEDGAAGDDELLARESLR
jgi:hypothetical protein